jgi:hypothetical protein
MRLSRFTINTRMKLLFTDATHAGRFLFCEQIRRTPKTNLELLRITSDPNSIRTVEYMVRSSRRTIGGARWPRGQCARREIAEAKQRFQRMGDQNLLS